VIGQAVDSSFTELPPFLHTGFYKAAAASDDVRVVHDLCAELLHGEGGTKADEKKTGGGGGEALLALCKPDGEVDAKARAMLAVFVWHCPQLSEALLEWTAAAGAKSADRLLVYGQRCPLPRVMRPQYCGSSS